MSTKPKTPDPTDHFVGERVRVARLLKGMSQTELGELLGITFQQVQKYEKGVNRVGAGRLMRIAELLGQDVRWFYGTDQGEAPQAAATIGADNPLQRMMTLPGGVALARAFIAIPNKDLRSALVVMARRLADDAVRQKQALEAARPRAA